MTPSRRLLPLLLLALAAAGSARAAEPELVATAPAASAPGVDGGAPAMSVGDQIDLYLKTSPAARVPKDHAAGVTSGAEEPRKIHGVVDVAVGTGGYRSAYVRSDIPVGKTGTLSVAAGETKFEGRGGRFIGGYGPGDRQSLSLGLALGGADPALDPHDPRCRQVREDGLDAPVDPRFDSGRSRACRAADPRTGP